VSGVAAWGGAIGLFGGEARLEASLFTANFAEGGVFTAMGGAAFAMYAYAEVERANFTANEARGATQGGTQFSFGGALALQSAEVNTSASGFVDNLCRAARQTCSGGAIYLAEKSVLSAVGSELTGNRASLTSGCSGWYADGGAISGNGASCIL
jgi:hypothetical protein